MLAEVSMLSAFLVGLLGGVHCVGMCGGIVGALSLGLPSRERVGATRWKYLLAYNAARIASYTLAGALFGGIGWLAANWSGLHQAQLWLQALAALFMVALGLYLGGWWQGLAHIEQLGASLWRRLEPLGRRFLPIATPRQAFLLGLLWGWLPCGLVYSVLVWAISTGNPLHGAALLLSFGIGTLPNLLAMGVAAETLSRRVRDPRTRRFAGGMVILFGIYSLYRLIG
ncbi:MAG TPA: sulfite exporter TauE/SafE family protein [Gammaproteobacteria bacterium]|nr:sulfite exporter TauE/SafE family protein [Gammaproteobacteria bacterium]